MIGLFIRTGLLLLAGALFGLVVNWARPAGISLRPESEPPSACEADLGPVVELDPVAAADLCVAASTLVVDVRSAGEFAAGRIPGAMHLPCSQSQLAHAASGQLSAAAAVLVYGNDTESARQVAASLRRYGYPVQILRGGYPAWEASGQACVSGPCEGCLGESHGDHQH